MRAWDKVCHHAEGLGARVTQDASEGQRMDAWNNAARAAVVIMDEGQEGSVNFVTVGAVAVGGSMMRCAGHAVSAIW